MLNTIKKYLIAGLSIAILALLAFSLYHTYQYGYQKGYVASEQYYLSELEKLKQSQQTEQNRVSELEKQLFTASQDYEALNRTLAAVQKENQEWKKQHQQDAEVKALLPSTVQRINEVLDASRP